jgi:hypothetical protein|tara:strand:+ start:225 stop:1163 length:939 start_codon:yes stop_codon:yes gene_type:complete
MGIVRQAARAYYGTSGEHGSYQYIPLDEVIDSFNATYVGKDKICEGISFNDVTFHAIRGLQELSYDTLKSTKDWEVVIPSTLVLVMPLDYINYVKLSWSDGSGIERIIYPTSKTSNPNNVATSDDPLVQDWGGWDTGNSLETTTDLVDSESSDTSGNYRANTGSDIGSVDADNVNDAYGNLVGGRYGIDPQHAQANGSFFIDESAGKFHFSSNIAGKTVILRYISDGIAATSSTDQSIDLTKSMVPKLAEEALYKHILYGVLLARKNTPGGLLGQLKKERYAETRKAKLRLSNIKIEELTQVLRGGSKMIKH